MILSLIRFQIWFRFPNDQIQLTRPWAFTEWISRRPMDKYVKKRHVAVWQCFEGRTLRRVRRSSDKQWGRLNWFTSKGGEQTKLWAWKAVTPDRSEGSGKRVWNLQNCHSPQGMLSCLRQGNWVNTMWGSWWSLSPRPFWPGEGASCAYSVNREKQRTLNNRRP